VWTNLAPRRFNPLFRHAPQGVKSAFHRGSAVPLHELGCNLNWGCFCLDFGSTSEYRSIILTTHKEFTAWGDSFHDDNIAVPVVDRIIHHSHIFMMGGESYRLKQKKT